MSSYQLRIADANLWAAVTRRARAEGRSKQFVLLALAREYVVHGLRPAEDMPLATTRRQGGGEDQS